MPECLGSLSFMLCPVCEYGSVKTLKPNEVSVIFGICNFTVLEIMADSNLGQEKGSILFGNVCILNTNWKMFVKLEYEKISPGEFYCLVDQNTVSLVLFWQKWIISIY